MDDQYNQPVQLSVDDQYKYTKLTELCTSNVGHDIMFHFIKFTINLRRVKWGNITKFKSK